MRAVLRLPVQITQHSILAGINRHRVYLQLLAVLEDSKTATS